MSRADYIAKYFTKGVEMADSAKSDTPRKPEALTLPLTVERLFSSRQQWINYSRELETALTAAMAKADANKLNAERYRTAINERHEYDYEYDGKMMRMCIHCGNCLDGGGKHSSDCVVIDAARSTEERHDRQANS